MSNDPASADLDNLPRPAYCVAAGRVRPSVSCGHRLGHRRQEGNAKNARLGYVMSRIRPLWILSLTAMASATGFALPHANSDARGTCVAAPSSLVAWWPGDGDASDLLGHYRL